MARRALIIDAKDNVATLLEEAEAGEDVAAGTAQVQAAEKIPAGHKVALVNIRAGEAVLKYGAVIGQATADIAAGSWVHEHNLQSAATAAPVSERADEGD